MSDDSRRRILERRAAFLAATVATLAGSACETHPKVCLSAVPEEKVKPLPADAGVVQADAGEADAYGAMPCLSEAPMPCLSPPLPPDAGPHPAVCLSVAKPKSDAGPRPCLKMPMPSDGGEFE